MLVETTENAAYVRRMCQLLFQAVSGECDSCDGWQLTAAKERTSSCIDSSLLRDLVSCCIPLIHCCVFFSLFYSLCMFDTWSIFAYLSQALKYHSRDFPHTFYVHCSFESAHFWNLETLLCCPWLWYWRWCGGGDGGILSSFYHHFVFVTLSCSHTISFRWRWFGLELCVRKCAVCATTTTNVGHMFLVALDASLWKHIAELSFFFSSPLSVSLLFHSLVYVCTKSWNCGHNNRWLSLFSSSETSSVVVFFGFIQCSLSVCLWQYANEFV